MALSKPLDGHNPRFLRKFTERKSFARATGMLSKRMPRVGISLKKVYQSLKTNYTVPAKYRFLQAPQAQKAAPDAWRSLDMSLPGRESPSASSLPAFQGPPPPPVFSRGQVIPRAEDDPAFRGGKKAAQPSAPRPAPAPNQRLYRRVEEITPAVEQQGGEAKPSEPSAPRPDNKPTVQREMEPPVVPPAIPPAERLAGPVARREPEPSLPENPLPAASQAPVETPMPRRPRPQAQTAASPAAVRMAARPARAPQPPSLPLVQREVEPPAPRSAPRRIEARPVERPSIPVKNPVETPAEPLAPVLPASAAPRPGLVPASPPERQAQPVENPRKLDAPPEPAPRTQLSVRPASRLAPLAARTVQREPDGDNPAQEAPKPDSLPNANPPANSPAAPQQDDPRPSEPIRLPLEIRRINRPVVRSRESTVQREPEAAPRSLAQAPLAPGVLPVPPVQPAESVVQREESPAAPEAPAHQGAERLPLNAPDNSPKETARTARHVPRSPSAPDRGVQRIAAAHARRPSAARPEPVPGSPAPLNSVETPAPFSVVTGEVPMLPVQQPGAVIEARAEIPPVEITTPHSAPLRIATRKALHRSPEQPIRRVLRKAAATGQVQRESELAKPPLPQANGQPLAPEKALVLTAPVGIKMAQKMKQKYPAQAEAGQSRPELPLASAAAPEPPSMAGLTRPAQGNLPGQVITRLVKPAEQPSRLPVEAGVVQRELTQEGQAAPVETAQAQPPDEFHWETESQPRPMLDLARVAEQVYPVILRKLAEEKRRSGR